MARRPRLLGTLICALVGTIAGATLLVSMPSCTIFSGLTFDGGTAGGGGSSSSSSTGTAGGPPGALHYLSMADAAKFCSRLAECPEPELQESVVNSTAVPVDLTNYSLCMTWAAGPIPSDRIGFAYQQKVLSCVAKAADCNAAGACNPREIFAGNDPRCAGKLDAGLDSGAEFCEDENTVIRCDTGGDALHCKDTYYSNSTCMVDADGTRWCASGENCSIQTECIGSVLNYCGGGSILQFSIDCSTLGLTCGTDAKLGRTDCLSDGRYATCMSQVSVCDGATVLSCNSDGSGSLLSPFHCDDLGGTCDQSHGAAFCHRADDTCTPFDAAVNKCDGSKVKLCVGGQNVDFDCATIGKTCSVSPNLGCH